MQYLYQFQLVKQVLSSHVMRKYTFISLCSVQCLQCAYHTSDKLNVNFNNITPIISSSVWSLPRRHWW